MRRLLILSALSLGSAAAGCGTDGAPATRASEAGDWKVLAATRDGRPIGTLESAYFTFDTAAARLTTNLLSEEVDMNYRREGATIVTDGPADLQAFEVRELTDSTLVLAAVIRGSAFELELRPAEVE